MLQAETFFAEGGVGHSEGEGMMSDGYLATVLPADFLTELEIMIGNSTPSSSVRLYSSLSKSEDEHLLLQREDASEVAFVDGLKPLPSVPRDDSLGFGEGAMIFPWHPTCCTST